MLIPHAGSIFTGLATVFILNPRIIVGWKCVLQHQLLKLWICCKCPIFLWFIRRLYIVYVVPWKRTVLKTVLIEVWVGTYYTSKLSLALTTCIGCIKFSSQSVYLIYWVALEKRYSVWSFYVENNCNLHRIHFNSH